MPLLSTPKALILVGEINDEIGAALLASVYSNRPPKHLIINSGGGDASLAHACACALEALPNLHTQAAGFCASSAIPLLLSGRKRTALPHTNFMTHALSGGFNSGSPRECRSYSKLFLRDERVYAEFLARRSGYKTTDWWVKWGQQERWFANDAALEMGLLTT